MGHIFITLTRLKIYSNIWASVGTALTISSENVKTYFNFVAFLYVLDIVIVELNAKDH